MFNFKKNTQSPNDMIFRKVANERDSLLVKNAELLSTLLDLKLKYQAHDSILARVKELAKENERLKAENDLMRYYKNLSNNLEKEILAERRIFNEEEKLRKENQQLKTENEKVFAAYKEWEDMATAAVKESQQVKSDIALREKEIVDMKVWYANLGTINQKLEQENQQLKTEKEELNQSINLLWKAVKNGSDLVCKNSDLAAENQQLKAQLEQAQSKPILLARSCVSCGKEALGWFIDGLCDKCERQSKPERKSDSKPNDRMRFGIKCFDFNVNSKSSEKENTNESERKPHKCPVCDGTGKERLYKSFVNLFAVLRDNHCQDAEGVVWKTCDSCEGIGIVWENK